MAGSIATDEQSTANQRNTAGSGAQNTHRPTGISTYARTSNDAPNIAPGEQTATGKKRRNHRAGRKKKARRQSFALGNEQEESADLESSTHDLHAASTSGTLRPPFYRLGQSGSNFSSTSLDSQALLDHRCV